MIYLIYIAEILDQDNSVAMGIMEISLLEIMEELQI